MLFTYLSDIKRVTQDMLYRNTLHSLEFGTFELNPNECNHPSLSENSNFSAKELLVNLRPVCKLELGDEFKS